MITFTPFLGFHIGSLFIATHGIALSAGILVAYLLARRAGKRVGLNLDLLDNMVVVAVIAGLIGARVAFVAVLGQDMTFLQMLKVWEGGLSSHGGYISAILAGVVYLKYKKVEVVKYADVLLPYMLIGWAIGRVGCLNSIGEWGWALSQPSPFAFNIYGVVRYPTSLFESLAYLLGFGLIWLGQRYWKWTKLSGIPSALTLFLFTLSRFLIDFLREYDQAYLVFTQSVTGVLAAASLLFILYRIFQERKKKL